jgi:CHASE2 domain-containing sensor protein
LKKVAWQILRQPSFIALFLLAALWNASISSDVFNHAIAGSGVLSETARELRDSGIHLQLRAFGLLSQLRPASIGPNNVRLVYLDDATHWSALHGSQPTNREFLARLIENASKASTPASVIGLDVELLSPKGFPDGSDAPERKDDDLLLAAIKLAGERRIPVVLASTYDVDEKGNNFELPNIFKQENLNAPGIDCLVNLCSTFGFINLFDEKRQIPIHQDLIKSDGSGVFRADSFALAMAKAFIGPDKSKEDGLLSPTTLPGKDILGIFLPESHFPSISALDLASGERAAAEKCRGSIVLIGGNWHDREGYGAPVDQHLSAVGKMSGLGLQANFLESILRREYSYKTALWFDILADFFGGFVICFLFEIVGSFRGRMIVVTLSFLSPIMCAWLLLIAANLYFDSFIPLGMFSLSAFYGLVKAQWMLSASTQNLSTRLYQNLTSEAAEEKQMSTANDAQAAPRAFISYSWDDDEHRLWVKTFAARLRGNGIDVMLDQWHAQPGDQLPEFMEKSIRQSDFVLIICTPKYKARSESPTGGVRYEGDIIKGEVFATGDHRKFIPILRRGNWTESAPSYLIGKFYLDFREGQHTDMYRDLLKTLWKKTEAPPPLGKMPEF